MKPSIAVLLGMKGKGGPPDDEDGDSLMPKKGESEGEHEELEAAADEVMHSLKEDDVPGFTKSLCALIDLHIAAREDDDKVTSDETAKEHVNEENDIRRSR